MILVAAVSVISGGGDLNEGVHFLWQALWLWLPGLTLVFPFDCAIPGQ